MKQQNQLQCPKTQPRQESLKTVPIISEMLLARLTGHKHHVWEKWYLGLHKSVLSKSQLPVNTYYLNL